MVGARGVILLYHRVTRLRCDPFGLAVRPSRFDAHLAVLRRRTSVMPLADLHFGLATSDLPEAAVAITFDDGYYDNLEKALPRLRRHGCPATVFVATGNIGTRRELWWDELERLVIAPRLLPRSLHLDVAGTAHAWSLEGGVRPGRIARFRARGWRAWHAVDPTPRHRLFREMWRLLHPLDADIRDAALSQLASQVGVRAAGRASHRLVDENELRRLASDPLIEIGGHTVTHPSLAHLEAARQHHEAAASRERLESIGQRAVTSFSYPFGTREDFDATTIDAVRRAGYIRACSNCGGIATSDDLDAYDLPRVVVQDWTGPQFEQRLDGWLAAQRPGDVTRPLR